MSFPEVNLNIQLASEAYGDKSLCQLEDTANLFATGFQDVLRTVGRTARLDTHVSRHA